MTRKDPLLSAVLLDHRQHIYKLKLIEHHKFVLTNAGASQVNQVNADISGIGQVPLVTL
jgi:hypothetical protein